VTADDWQRGNATFHGHTPPATLAVQYQVEPRPGALCKVWLAVRASTDAPGPVIWQRTHAEYTDGTNVTAWSWLEAGDPVFVRRGGADTEPLPTVWGVHSWDVNSTAGVLSLGGPPVSRFDVTWVIDGADHERLNGVAALETGIACGPEGRWRVLVGKEAFLGGPATFGSTLAVTAPGAVTVIDGSASFEFTAPCALAAFARGGEGEVTLSGAVSAQRTFSLQDEDAVLEWTGPAGEVVATLDWKGAGEGHRVWLAGYSVHPLERLADFPA
jgi:hypothetical protein